MKVYVIELITYDYFEYSKFVGVELTKEKAFETAYKITKASSYYSSDKCEIFYNDEEYKNQDFRSDEKMHFRITEYQTSEAAE